MKRKRGSVEERGRIRAERRGLEKEGEME